MHIPSGYAQVNHFFTGAGMPRGAQITYGVFLQPAATPAGVATEMSAAWETAWKSATPISVTHSKVRVKFGPPDTGPFAEGGSSFAGTYNTPVDAPQVAVLVKKNTDRGGREGAGRFFLPVVPEADTLNGGTIDPTALAALQTRANNWLTDVTGGTHVDFMCLLHNDPLTTPDEITSLTVMSLLSTQRRRIRKVGGRRSVAP